MPSALGTSKEERSSALASGAPTEYPRKCHRFAPAACRYVADEWRTHVAVAITNGATLYNAADVRPVA